LSREDWRGCPSGNNSWGISHKYLALMLHSLLGIR
jgi:hypothetical protein